MVLTYHRGKLLEGNVPLSIIWYGDFTPSQKSIIVDFILSLNHQKNPSESRIPRVYQWWKTIQINYLKRAGKKETQFFLSNQVSDVSYSLGKLLKKPQISQLAKKANPKPNGLTLVLTAKEVAVEGFCMSSCGFHGSVANGGARSAFIWVGDSVAQCPGQCAWPFHQPIYGPQTAPLGAPNGDVGVDGMVVNIATLLAGTVTNPFRDGYFLGSVEAPLEAGSACPGIYGKGAYPGYAGKLLMDSTSGASYNSVGLNSRKYLLPAVFDPSTSQCTTPV